MRRSVCQGRRLSRHGRCLPGALWPRPRPDHAVGVVRGARCAAIRDRAPRFRPQPVALPPQPPHRLLRIQEEFAQCVSRSLALWGRVSRSRFRSVRPPPPRHGRQRSRRIAPALSRRTGTGVRAGIIIGGMNGAIIGVRHGIPIGITIGTTAGATRTADTDPVDALSRRVRRSGAGLGPQGPLAGGPPIAAKGQHARPFAP